MQHSSLLLDMRLTALAPIRQLPHFHGVQWSACLRHLLRPVLGGKSLAEAGIWPVPMESGIDRYERGESIQLGLVCPADCAVAVGGALQQFSPTSGATGHFQPGVTVACHEIHCRIADTPWQAQRSTPLDDEHLAEEIALLASLPRFTLRFTTPLRLTRLAGNKGDGHRYLDAESFSGPDCSASLTALLQRIRGMGESELDAGRLAIAESAVTWIDLPYGGHAGKTLGGIVGSIVISGTPTLEAARRLVIGQYLGAGKNPAFGFGFFEIEELVSCRCIRPLQRGKTLLSRSVELPALKAALDKMQETTPGPDGLTVQDLKAAGLPLIERLREDLLAGRFAPPTTRLCRIPKTDGKFRELHIPNALDRLVMKSVAAILSPPIERLLTGSSYAYRRGLSRHSAATALQKLLSAGYDTGLKADISAFFDSVDTIRMKSLLNGLFPAEPLVALIAGWLDHARQAGISGLPQGWAISPVLSNLYLDHFDREMESIGFRLIRFADDFVVLFPPGYDRDVAVEQIRAALATIGLSLKEEKTETVIKGRPIRFLGLLIAAEEVTTAPSDSDEVEAEGWGNVFRSGWKEGEPVYLTSICHGAFSRGSHLVVRNERDEDVSFPWGRISRIIVTGRAHFSGGIIYRAMREAISVTFINVMGRITGRLDASGHETTTELSAQQRLLATDATFCLDFSRAVICAKIRNSAVLLRRNGIDLPELAKLEASAATAENLDQLRGFEGAAAHAYFHHFPELVAPFDFAGRVYRPPDGPVNVLLSFGYTLLYNRIASVLRARGFDPRIGFFHQGRGTHCALVSDLLEPLRHLSDRNALALIHRKEVSFSDFETCTVGGQPSCRMTGQAFRACIHRYETTMASKFTFGDKGKISYNAYLDSMVEMIIRTLKLGVPFTPLRIR